MPGAKDLLTCAVMAGGAFPHRLGLSETVLVFEQHLSFFGGFNRFVEELPRIKARCVEKKLFVEADTKRAIALARASAGGHGVDGIQLDKFQFPNWRSWFVGYAISIPESRLSPLVVSILKMQAPMLHAALTVWLPRRRLRLSPWI